MFRIISIHSVRSRGTAGSLAPPNIRAWLSLGLSMWVVSGVTHLCIGKDRGRNDLVRPERLSRVDKGCQNLARLPALACHVVSDVITQTMDGQLLTPHGRGQRVIDGERHVGGGCGRMAGGRGEKRKHQPEYVGVSGDS